MSHNTHTLPVLILAALAWPSFASASSLESEIASANRINAANVMLREGKIDEAIDGYQQVQATAGDRDALGYNLGVAQFRNGDIAAAKKAFTEAAASGDASLASSSRYNLGNCLYSEAVQQAEHDKAAAIQSLRDAISHYRGALRGNPNNAPRHADARANIEWASELIRKLEEEQQDQNSDQQKSDQQQSQQDSPSQPSEDSENQESQGGDDQSNSSQSESSETRGDDQASETSEENQSDNAQQQRDGSDDQSSSNAAEEKPSEHADEQRQQQPSEQQSPANDRQSGEHSQADQQRPDGGDRSPDEESDPSQEIPTGELSAAGEQEQEQGDSRAAVMADANVDDGLMSKEEALKMLQAVRDRDMLRRLRQQQAERSRHVPVDRDW